MAWWRDRVQTGMRQLAHMCAGAEYTAHERAVGAALGVSVGLLPVTPLQLLLLAGICMRVRCHRALAFVTVWILNPFTIIPLYAAEYWCGRVVCERWFGACTPLEELMRANVLTLVRHCPREVLALVSGGVVFSAVAGVLTYFITRVVVWCMALSSRAVTES